MTSVSASLRGKRAHRWAMSWLREEVNRWLISPERRATILSGLGPPLWRAIQQGEVRTRGELASLVRALVHRLREAEGVSGDLRAACKYGRWAVRGALGEAMSRFTEERPLGRRGRSRESEI